MFTVHWTCIHIPPNMYTLWLTNVSKCMCLITIILVSVWIVSCKLFYLQVYVAECVGVHIIGYVFIVYGAISAAASVCTGKILGRVSITILSLLTMCLNVGIIAFLLIWEREPNYFVIFVITVLWGICDGSWASACSSKL